MTGRTPEMALRVATKGECAVRGTKTMGALDDPNLDLLNLAETFRSTLEELSAEYFAT